MKESKGIDAQIKDIKITPAHFDKDHYVDRDEFATVTIKVPMDSQEATDWITGLFAHLSREYIKVEVTDPQMDLPGIEEKGKSETVTLTAAQAEAQLEAANSM